jgi:hypothetical protein
MSTPEDSADLIITGRVGALRDLAETPPQLSELQQKVMHWYDQLAQRLAGPRSGNERGPAQQPPWVKQGPTITGAEPCADEDGRWSFLIDGSQLERTTSVWMDGVPAPGFEVVSPSRLLAPVPKGAVIADGSVTVIEVRTTSGDVVIRSGGPETTPLSS